VLESAPSFAVVEFLAASSKEVGFCQINAHIAYSLIGHKSCRACAGANQPGAQFASSGSIVSRPFVACGAADCAAVAKEQFTALISVSKLNK